MEPSQKWNPGLGGSGRARSSSSTTGRSCGARSGGRRSGARGTSAARTATHAAASCGTTGIALGGVARLSCGASTTGRRPRAATTTGCRAGSSIRGMSSGERGSLSRKVRGHLACRSRRSRRPLPRWRKKTRGLLAGSGRAGRGLRGDPYPRWSVARCRCRSCSTARRCGASWASPGLRLRRSSGPSPSSRSTASARCSSSALTSPPTLRHARSQRIRCNGESALDCQHY
jgi:hypothetical protein